VAVVDLHLHTSHSDGSLTPSDLVNVCFEKGLQIIAISDHDTTEGIREAQKVAEPLGIEIVPSVELGTRLGESEIHVLGYFINPDDVVFQEMLENYREAREVRAKNIVLQLNATGVPLLWEKVSDLAGFGSIGRPHIAHALIELGYAKDIQEAFQRYLGLGTQGYVPRDLNTPQQAVRVIEENGGIAVIAHPLFTNTKLDRHDIPDLDDLIESLCDEGLKGLEVFYGDYTDGQIKRLLEICRKFQLVPCGGSDYHAIGAQNEVLPGDVGPPMEHFAELKRLSNVV